MISTIILDFDGVILESVSVKTEAFREIFSSEPNHLEEIIDFHIRNGGMSRFDKFRHIYNVILKEDLTQKKFEELSEKFSSIVFKKLIKAPFVPGAQEFLKTYHAKIPLYIVSATPEEELIQIIQKRELSHYFRKVFGAPQKKSECISEIIKITGYPPRSVIFVGDAKNDFDAAQVTGVRFIGRIEKERENLFGGLTGIDTIIPDLWGLSRYIEVHQ